MRLIKTLLVCFLLTICLVGCGNPQMNEASNADLQTDKEGTYEWISPDGVHYWVYHGYYQYGIAPRYNSDGYLIIDEGNEE